MPTPVPESIATTLVTRLNAITIANGYAFTAASVDRVNRDATEWTPKNNSIVVIQGDSQRETVLDCPGNPPANGWRLPFAVAGFVRQSDRVTTADQSKENEIAAAIIKAVASVSNWHTFGGYAVNAEIGAVTRLPASESMAGVRVQFDVHYRVSEDDPFEVRA